MFLMRWTASSHIRPFFKIKISKYIKWRVEGTAVRHHIRTVTLWLETGLKIPVPSLVGQELTSLFRPRYTCLFDDDDDDDDDDEDDDDDGVWLVVKLLIYLNMLMF